MNKYASIRIDDYICNHIAFSLKAKQKISKRLDLAGMLISGLCALHCSLIPLAVLLGMGSGLTWMLSHEVEILFFVISLSLASASLIYSYIKHRKISVLLFALTGFAFFIIGHEYLTLAPKILLTSIGGMFILLAHYLNLKFQSHCYTFALKS